VPSNEQRRQAAKRKLERQLERRAERAKRRRRQMALGASATVVAVVVIVVGIVFLTGNHGSPSQAASSSPTTTTTAAPPAKTTSGPCKYTSTPTQPAPNGKDEGMPSDPNPTPKTGTVTVTLKTSDGDIPMTLNRAEAPCTVQSFIHLAQKTYFNNTPCHRMTAYPTPPLKVLQCGDPTGAGSGGPGYTIPDEKPTTLKPAPAAQGQPASSVYPAGAVAMANTGHPHSGGSQFFLVYADSQLPPNYSVFGTITPDGMTTLNKIAAAGIIPSTNPTTGAPTTTDGKPKMPVTIQQAVVSG
jgi:peptidyl-prolyl cis-trans isomerase B (cyclophilin B)